MAQESLSSPLALIGMLGAVWGVIYNHFELLLGGFFLLLIACIIMIVEWLKPKRPKIKNINYKEMIAKIFEKYQMLKTVLGEFNKNGKKKEDEPTVVEAVKVIAKDLSDILEGKGEDNGE